MTVPPTTQVHPAIQFVTEAQSWVQAIASLDETAHQAFFDLMEQLFNGERDFVAASRVLLTIKSTDDPADPKVRAESDRIRGLLSHPGLRNGDGRVLPLEAIDRLLHLASYAEKVLDNGDATRAKLVSLNRPTMTAPPGPAPHHDDVASPRPLLPSTPPVTSSVVPGPGPIFEGYDEDLSPAAQAFLDQPPEAIETPHSPRVRMLQRAADRASVLLGGEPVHT